MKIRISDIPHEGLAVKEHLSLEAINERLRNGEDHGIEFLTPPLVSLTVFKTPQGAETRGSVNARYRQPCSRCIEGIERDIAIEANLIFKAKPADLANRPPGEEDEDYIDDVGISYFEGEHIDLESILQETLILSLSIYWHPPVDRTGKCTVCSLFYNDTSLGKGSPERRTTLGELMQAAARKK